MAHDSARDVDEEDDLDGILDSALAEFDVAPPPISPVDGDLVPPEPDGVGGKPAEVSEGSGAVSKDAEDRGKDNGLDAFEEALSSLGALDAGGNGENGALNEEQTEGEDLKLVEEFLKSLSTQFEEMGLHSEGNGSTAAGLGGETGAAPVGDGRGAGTLPSEAEIDKITRDLEALLRSEGSNVDLGNLEGVEPAGGGSPGNSGGGSASGAPGGAAASSAGGDFSKIVESVVGELLSKDILKGPMEQMRDAYEEWLPANAESLSEAETARYQKQSEIVSKICGEYAKDDCRMEDVMTLLTEMQSTGSPPQAIMEKLGDKNGGDAGDDDATRALDLLNPAKCPVQ